MKTMRGFSRLIGGLVALAFFAMAGTANAALLHEQYYFDPDAAPVVQAFISGGSAANPIMVTGTTGITTVAFGNSTATADGAGGGVADVGTSRAIAKWRPPVESLIGRGLTTLVSGGKPDLYERDQDSQTLVIPPEEMGYVRAFVNVDVRNSKWDTLVCPRAVCLYIGVVRHICLLVRRARQTCIRS